MINELLLHPRIINDTKTINTLILYNIFVFWAQYLSADFIFIC